MQATAVMLTMLGTRRRVVFGFEPSCDLDHSMKMSRPVGLGCGAVATTGRRTAMNSTVKKRSIVIGHHKTSISLEDGFWTSLLEIARSRQMTVSDLVASLDATRENSNLSSATRVFILDHYCAMSGLRNRELAEIQVAVANGREAVQAGWSLTKT
jgi:predicted DNA-binding ribbon-helix-helix protein